MSTPETPSSTPSTTSSSGGRGYGFQPVAGARMPIPGNAEFLFFVVIWIVMFIFWLASDNFATGLFMTLTAIIATGYVLSRGIAKASRVLEQ
jgi:hypothetical protein